MEVRSVNWEVRMGTSHFPVLPSHFICALPSFCATAVSATWRPWDRAMASSISEGWRLPSPAARVGGAVGGTARHLIQGQLALLAVGQTHDGHAQMHEVDDGGDQRGFLAAVLAGRGGKHAAHLAHQLVLEPQLAGLVEKVGHLCGHAAVAGGGADDDGVVVGQFGGGGDGRGLVQLGAGALGHVLGHQLRDPLDDGLGALHFAHALGHGLGHLLHVAPGGVIQDQHFGVHGRSSGTMGYGNVASLFVAIF